MSSQPEILLRNQATKWKKDQHSAAISKLSNRFSCWRVANSPFPTGARTGGNCQDLTAFKRNSFFSPTGRFQCQNLVRERSMSPFRNYFHPIISALMPWSFLLTLFVSPLVFAHLFYSCLAPIPFWKCCNPYTSLEDKPFPIFGKL